MVRVLNACVLRVEGHWPRPLIRRGVEFGRFLRPAAPRSCLSRLPPESGQWYPSASFTISASPGAVSWSLRSESGCMSAWISACVVPLRVPPHLSVHQRGTVLRMPEPESRSGPDPAERPTMGAQAARSRVRAATRRGDSPCTQRGHTLAGIPCCASDETKHFKL